MNLLTLLKYNFKWPVYSEAGIDHIFSENEQMYMALDATGELFLYPAIPTYKVHTGTYSVPRYTDKCNKDFWLQVYRMGDIRYEAMDDHHPCEVCLPVTKEEVLYILSYRDTLP